MQEVRARVTRTAISATAIACAALACATPSAWAGGQTLGIVANEFSGTFSDPVSVTSAPGSPRLVFVVQQGGVVRVVRSGDKLQRPFLDIRARVTSGGEQGLLSIAFPPDYAQTRRFYAYFNNGNCDPGTGGCDIEVAEFRRTLKSATRARARSHRRVLTIRHRDAANHNGGTAMFGPDGKLWLATGDGGGAGDEFDNARKRTSLLGKLLRIDPRDPRGRRDYRIPPGNPFVGTPGRDEIWSIGLRNPFRFSFDPPRDAIAIGDVGQGAREEINFVTLATAKGANFGWPQFEGNQIFDNDRPGPGPLLPPMYTYPNPPVGGASVIGGVVLRDPRFQGVPDADPDDGIYLFADAFSGPLQRFEPVLATNTINDYQTVPNADVGFPAGFGTDRQQRVYVASLGSDRVYRLDPAP